MTAPSIRTPVEQGRADPPPAAERRGSPRRRSWTVGGFAVVASVLIGQRCMCPDPAAALRRLAAGSAQLRGSPMRLAPPAAGTPVAAPAGAGAAPAASVVAAAEEPRPPIAAPAPAAPPRPAQAIESTAVKDAPAAAKQAEKPAADPTKFKTVTWGDISKFSYVPPEPKDTGSAAADLPPAEEIARSTESDRIPEEILEMSGTRIAIDGYVVPLDYDHGKVVSFILLSSPLACCFAEAPPFNRWVLVTNDVKSALDYAKYDVVRVSGVFDVGEHLREGYVVSIYRMHLEKIDAVKQ